MKEEKSQQQQQQQVKDNYTPLVFSSSIILIILICCLVRHPFLIVQSLSLRSAHTFLIRPSIDPSRARNALVVLLAHSESLLRIITACSLLTFSPRATTVSFLWLCFCLFDCCVHTIITTSLSPLLSRRNKTFYYFSLIMQPHIHIQSSRAKKQLH